MQSFSFLETQETRRRGLVVMDFDCYIGDRSSIPTQGDSLGKWMNLHPGQPMPCEGNWVVSPRCWRDIDLRSVYNWKNGLLSLMQFNHIHTYNPNSIMTNLYMIWTLPQVSLINTYQHQTIYFKMRMWAKLTKRHTLHNISITIKTPWHRIIKIVLLVLGSNIILPYVIQ